MNPIDDDDKTTPLDFHKLEAEGKRFATALRAWPVLRSLARESDGRITDFYSKN